MRAPSLSLALFPSYLLISLALSLSSSLFFSLSAYPTPPWWASALNTEVYNIRINFYEQVSVLQIATLRYDISLFLSRSLFPSLIKHRCHSFSISVSRSPFLSHALFSLARSHSLSLSSFPSLFFSLSPAPVVGPGTLCICL